MANILQLRNGTKEEWAEVNPILAEGEPGLILGADGNFVIGDGIHHYNDLPQHAWGWDAYDVLVHHGNYKGTREDFCRHMKAAMLSAPEQQIGELVNDGAGWNSFVFPREFNEEVYVFLTPQDSTIMASVKNITKSGFQYCLFDENGDTVDGMITINYLAIAVSELNLAQAIAQAAGLSPFDYDNLTTLFSEHAAEVVSNEAAFNLVKKSSFASCVYLCYLTGLNRERYLNMNSVAEDPTAMTTIANNHAACLYILDADGAYDSIRYSEMAMCKLICGALETDSTDYNTVEDLSLNLNLINSMLAYDQLMQRVCDSERIISKMVGNSDIVEGILTNASTLAIVTGHKISYHAFCNNTLSIAKYLCLLYGEDIQHYGDLETLMTNTTLITNMLKKATVRQAIYDSEYALDKIASNSNFTSKICDYLTSEIYKNPIAINTLYNNDAACTYYGASESHYCYFACILAGLPNNKWAGGKSSISSMDYDYYMYVYNSTKSMLFASRYGLAYLTTNSSTFYKVTLRNKRVYSAIVNDKKAISNLLDNDTFKNVFYSYYDEPCQALLNSEVGRNVIFEVEKRATNLASQSRAVQMVGKYAHILHAFLKNENGRKAIGTNYGMNYSDVLKTIQDEKYFVYFKDYFTFSSQVGYRTSDGVKKEQSLEANESMFLLTKWGATSATSVSSSDYVYIAGLAYSGDSQHSLRYYSGAINGGGQQTDEAVGGYTSPNVVCVGGVKNKATSVAYFYARGWFVLAK